jgi:eukaryotic-like serine/threonine-protein kinase
VTDPARLNDPKCYAAQLSGRELADGWRVVSRIDSSDDHTGGHFSVSYVVERGKERAFLKALDLLHAFKAPDVLGTMNAMTTAFQFERDLLERCAQRRMDRVVVALASGQVQVVSNDPQTTVPYIIFELGEGDIRAHLRLLSEVDMAWALRALHGIAVGIQQLHAADIAHQDLKPSNALVITPEFTKVADLGRAARHGIDGPFDELSVPGAKPNAAPELRYRAVPTDWRARRICPDLYQLGSLMMFVLDGVTMNAALFGRVAVEHQPSNWTGTFPDVLPILQKAFGEVLSDLAERVPSDVVDVVQYLCEPDPEKRGHPTARAQKHGDPYSLESVVSTLLTIASRHERKLIRARGP